MLGALWITDYHWSHCCWCFFFFKWKHADLIAHFALKKWTPQCVQQSGTSQRFWSNNIPRNAPKYRSTWPKYALVRNQAALGRILCRNLNIRAVPRCSCLHQYLLTYIPSFPANHRRSFGIQQTLVGEETWRRGEGRRESRWATPSPHVPAESDKDRVFATNGSPLASVEQRDAQGFPPYAPRMNWWSRYQNRRVGIWIWLSNKYPLRSLISLKDFSTNIYLNLYSKCQIIFLSNVLLLSSNASKRIWLWFNAV